MQELSDSIVAFVILAFLTAILAAGFLGFPIYWLSKNARRLCHLCRSRSFPVFAAFTAAAIIYGGSKPPWANRYLTVAWDEYFTAPLSAMADTNDWRIASFAWNHAAFLPGTANAVFYAANRFDDVPSLAEIGRCPITNRAFTVQMPEDATNYLYSAVCDWTPPQPVVTNGVYHLRAIGNPDRAVPLGSTVKTPDNPEGEYK